MNKHPFLLLFAGLAITFCLTGTAQAQPRTQLLAGDLDFDGRVTAVDARLALRGSAHLQALTDRQKRAGSVLRFDDNVTAADARHILRMSAELETLDVYLNESGPVEKQPFTKTERLPDSEIPAPARALASGKLRITGAVADADAALPVDLSVSPDALRIRLAQEDADLLLKPVTRLIGGTRVEAYLLAERGDARRFKQIAPADLGLTQETLNAVAFPVLPLNAQFRYLAEFDGVRRWVFGDDRVVLEIDAEGDAPTAVCVYGADRTLLARTEITVAGGVWTCRGENGRFDLRFADGQLQSITVYSAEDALLTRLDVTEASFGDALPDDWFTTKGYLRFPSNGDFDAWLAGEG